MIRLMRATPELFPMVSLVGLVGCCQWPAHPMPTLPPGLTEWLPSGFFTALLGLIWYEVKASEARTNKRIDELREEQKELRGDMKEGLAKLEARQEAMRAEQREENKALNEKLDRLIESRLPTSPRQ